MGNRRKAGRPPCTKGNHHTTGSRLATAIRCWTLLSLFLTTACCTFAAQLAATKTIPLTTVEIEPKSSNDAAPAQKKLWKKQSYLILGLAGYREVRETDLFSIRQFNPTGPDMLLQQEMEVTTRHGFYPIVTVGGAIHRNSPLYNRKAFNLHTHLAASLLYQKIILQSTLDNPTMSGDNYPVHYFNMPTITKLSVEGGIWINQLISAGVELNLTSLRLQTSDDRVLQKETSIFRLSLHPYLACWIPLEHTRMQRWSARATASLSPPGIYNYPFWTPAAEIALFRLSKQHTGRATGFFVRFLSQPKATFDEYPEYQFHRDIQVLAGITVGAGGHNRRGGR